MQTSLRQAKDLLVTKLDNRGAEAGDLALAVRIGKDIHAIPVSAVEEVLPALPIEPLAGCAAFIRGVVFVRGHLIPVLDAAERLGICNHQLPLEPHIVCLRLGDRLVGMLVDEAVDLMALGDQVRLDAHALGTHRGFLSCVVESEGTIIRVLNPNHLLEEQETELLDEMPAPG